MKEANWNYLDECAAAARRGCPEAAVVAEGVRRVLAREAVTTVSTYPCAFNGRHHWYQVAATSIPDEGGARAVLMHTDVTSLQHDALTGLANRALFDAQLDFTLSEARRLACPAALLSIDLNEFKPVNDRYGHPAGDALLRIFAERLRSCAGTDDLAARIGGDEFGIVLAPGADRVAVSRLAEAVATSLTVPFAVAGTQIVLRASIGWACFPEDGADAAALVATADAAMYAAKRNDVSRSAALLPA